MNANVPRKQLFKATADEERPTLESTMYANVLVYTKLGMILSENV